MRMSNTDQATAEALFVQFINENAESVKALASLAAMTESEKIELIRQFVAAK